MYVWGLLSREVSVQMVCEYLFLGMHLVDNSKSAQFFFRLPFHSISCNISVYIFPQHVLESFDKANINPRNLITFIYLL